MIDFPDQFNLSNHLKNQDKEGVIKWYQVYYSDLGGKQNASIIVKASIDSKENWPNGIMQNSSYSMFHVSFNMAKNRYVVVQFSMGSGMNKFRKSSTCKTLFDVANKIVNYFNNN